VPSASLHRISDGWLRSSKCSIGAECGDGWRSEPACRDGDRRGNRSGLYDVWRHVFCRYSRLCPNLRDHGGLLYIASVVSGLVGGVGVVIDHAAAAGKLDFFPPATFAAWIPFIGAWITMMLGSIPQQDVFQRVTSAKDERTAVRGSILAVGSTFASVLCRCF